VPVVATGVGGVPDLLGEETGREPGLSIRERGIMVTEATPEAFSRGMELVLDDQKTASKIAARAKEYATRRFDVKRLLRELGDMYLELLGKGKTGK
jgi:glycosyltransferase involved in cell wall biosynthesis